MAATWDANVYTRNAGMVVSPTLTLMEVSDNVVGNGKLGACTSWDGPSPVPKRTKMEP